MQVQFKEEEIVKYVEGEVYHPLFLINKQQEIKFEKVANCRDLARVYLSSDKSLIKFKDRVLFRSAVPLSATENDIEKLRSEMKIKTWVIVLAYWENY